MTISQTLESVERNRDAITDRKNAVKVSHITIAICMVIVVARITVNVIKG